ncbi:MAG: phospholipase D family protein [Proteobacteria bacterium]|nr:phospholipase D family protein [Pseudomonadota bacterium]
MLLSPFKRSIPILCFLLVLGGCASLPPNSNTLKSYALQDTADTRLGKAYHELKKDHSEKSGLLLLGNGLDAFTARLLLAQGADRSIDAQYYMIHQDLTGALFLDHLIKAADRGVRVRVLLDDINLGDRDELLAVLVGHPNIDLRIFNPFIRNVLRTPQLLTRFGSVTRRMHNKSFTVDNQVTVVGGRNIGKEYFDADPDLTFADVDILAIGPVAKEVSASFDEYWNSKLSYPITILRPDLVGVRAFEEARTELDQYLSQKSVSDYQRLLQSSHLTKAIKENSIQFTWGDAKVLADHPDKIKSYAADDAYKLTSQFKSFWENLHSELLIFSPYFVPGTEGTKYLSDLSKSGIRVRILTNSLASTDVGMVHAGYAKYRLALLRAGVELYEINKKTNKEDSKADKGLTGSSKASLHAKSFIFDRKYVFIGSLNFDPRSVEENTEIGILLTSEEVADTVADAFDLITKKHAFRLELQTDENGIEYITWHGLENGKERIWISDPHTGFLRRFGLFFMGLLPIESQL